MGEYDVMAEIWIIFFVLVVGQLFIAGILGGRLSRLGSWMMMLVCVVVMHLVSLGSPALLRMVWICSVMLASMKVVVYREWCVGRGLALPWMRWWMFAGLWFGMDPGAFLRRRKVEWRSHAMVGSLCLVGGVVLVWICYLLEVDVVLALFVSMSLAFHFGVLRLMTGFWRMMGYPVRVLFRNPFKMRGFRDFWSKRWNLAYSEMVARAVKRPLTPLLGERGSVFAGFVVSGLLHELAITVPVGAGYGWPTLFFVFHGVCCLMERRSSGLMGLVCGVVLVMGVPVLFGEEFVDEVILPSRDVMGVFNER